MGILDERMEDLAETELLKCFSSCTGKACSRYRQCPMFAEVEL